MPMERMLQLGPLALPWTLLILLAAWQLGNLVHERLSARSGLAPGPHGPPLPTQANFRWNSNP